jgi:hypothetical protein
VGHSLPDVELRKSPSCIDSFCDAMRVVKQNLVLANIPTAIQSASMRRRPKQSEHSSHRIWKTRLKRLRERIDTAKR